MNVKEWATRYIDNGLRVVPLEPRSKACYDGDWRNLIFKPEDFRDDDNIGIMSVDGLVDIDCDAEEMVAVAAAFLPPTPAIYGRPGKPASHWLYRAKFDKLLTFKDHKTGKTIVEIRIDHQSMAPPSIHPSGEQVEWVNGVFLAPIEIETEVLLRAIRLATTCALIARYYNPPGARHDWGMALAGFLRSLGVTEDEAKKIFQEAGQYVNDPEVKDRILAVRSTYSRDEDEAVRGAGWLRKELDHGKELVTSINRAWGRVPASAGFIMNEKDQVIANDQRNVRKALEKMDVRLKFDVFSQKPLVKHNGYMGPLDDAIVTHTWLKLDSTFHFRPAFEFYEKVVSDTARTNVWHPVKEYLEPLQWDGQPRIDEWLIRYGKAADSPYVRAVSRILLLAAVRRIMQPGCKFDEMAILESPQGADKSSALAALCPNPDWFSDDLPLNVDSKQIIERTRGKWIIEAAELQGNRASQAEHLKAMLSRQTDGPVRMAWGRLPIEQPRQFIIVGTTNEHQYLNDYTGNRRFWPIRVDRFDIAGIIRDRDQLWAEARDRERAGESIRLPEDLWAMAGLQQERRRKEDPWEMVLEEHFGSEGKSRVTPNEVWTVLGIPIEKRDSKSFSRVLAIMQQLNFRRMTVVEKDDEGGVTAGKRVKGWGRDSDKPEARVLQFDNRGSEEDNRG